MDVAHANLTGQLDANLCLRFGFIVGGERDFSLASG
jgi:hypothetical protein